MTSNEVIQQQQRKGNNFDEYNNTRKPDQDGAYWDRHKYKEKMYCSYCESFIPANKVVWVKAKQLWLPRCPNRFKGTCKGIKLRSGSANLKTRRKFTKPKRY